MDRSSGAGALQHQHDQLHKTSETIQGSLLKNLCYEDRKIGSSGKRQHRRESEVNMN